jgi:hypothetical protein
MSSPRSEDERQLDELLARVEEAARGRVARALVLGAVSCVLAAGLALLLDWQTELHSSGVAARSGYAAAPAVVPVMGVIALVLLALAYWQVDRPVVSGWAGVPCAIAAIGCIGGLHAGSRPDQFGGPAGWFAFTAFAAATVLAAISATRPSGATASAAEKADALRRLRRTLTRSG